MAEDKLIAVDPREGLTARIEKTAEVFFRSGIFPDVRNVGQAIIKILAGQELGIPPFMSMSGFDLIELNGRTVLAPDAHLVASLVRRSGRYDYRVLRFEDVLCELAFTDRGREIGRSVFRLEDAQRAGLAGKHNWRSWPRAMLYARAMTQGARMFCPDVFLGGVYTAEELCPDVVVQARAREELPGVDPPASTIKDAEINQQVQAVEAARAAAQETAPEPAIRLAAKVDRAEASLGRAETAALSVVNEEIVLLGSLAAELGVAPGDGPLAPDAVAAAPPPAKESKEIVTLGNRLATRLGVHLPATLANKVADLHGPDTVLQASDAKAVHEVLVAVFGSDQAAKGVWRSTGRTTGAPVLRRHVEGVVSVLDDVRSGKIKTKVKAEAAVAAANGGM